MSNYTVVNKDKCVDYNGVSGFNKLLSETYPQNALEIQNIINTFIEISNAMISLADKNCADVRYFYSILSKYKNISLLDYLKKETSNNKIWNEFCRYWMYLGVYPDKLSLVFMHIFGQNIWSMDRIIRFQNQRGFQKHFLK